MNIFEKTINEFIRKKVIEATKQEYIYRKMKPIIEKETKKQILSDYSAIINTKGQQ